MKTINVRTGASCDPELVLNFERETQMKLTQLGKELRKIRIGREEVLFDMAKRLGISSAMLSAIETGTKPAPEGFVNRLAEQYEEVAQVREYFEHLCEMTKKVLKVSLDLPEDKKSAVLAFNRVLPQMTPEDIQSLTVLFGKYCNKGDYENKIEGPDM